VGSGAYRLVWPTSRRRKRRKREESERRKRKEKEEKEGERVRAQEIGKWSNTQGKPSKISSNDVSSRKEANAHHASLQKIDLRG
jgi:hypothetical protein